MRKRLVLLAVLALSVLSILGASAVSISPSIPPAHVCGLNHGC